MPEIVNREWLERIGISSNLVPKNIHALRFLGLIDENGYTTPVASRLRSAASEEYAPVLEEIIRKAYRRIFEVRNPSDDSRTRIDDAFRHEQPQAQRTRMVACFLGLCALALIPLKEAPPVVRESRRPTVPRQPRASVIPEQRMRPPQAPPSAYELRRSGHARGVLDPVLMGLLNTLPEIEKVDELDDWYTVFRAAFGFINNRHARIKNEAAE